MRPFRVIAPQSSTKSADTSIFHELTLQQLCKDARIILVFDNFYKHSMQYLTVFANFNRRLP